MSEWVGTPARWMNSRCDLPSPSPFLPNIGHVDSSLEKSLATNILGSFPRHTVLFASSRVFVGFLIRGRAIRGRAIRGEATFRWQQREPYLAYFTRSLELQWYHTKLIATSDESLKQAAQPEPNHIAQSIEGIIQTSSYSSPQGDAIKHTSGRFVEQYSG